MQPGYTGVSCEDNLSNITGCHSTSAMTEVDYPKTVVIRGTNLGTSRPDLCAFSVQLWMDEIV